MKNHILIVEDDEAIREGVRILLGGRRLYSAGGRGWIPVSEKASCRNRSDYTGYYDAGISGIKTCEEIRKNFSIVSGIVSDC